MRNILKVKINEGGTGDPGIKGSVTKVFEI